MERIVIELATDLERNELATLKEALRECQKDPCQNFKGILGVESGEPSAPVYQIRVNSHSHYLRVKNVESLKINEHRFIDCELLLTTERVIDLLETISLPDLVVADYFKYVIFDYW